MLKGFEVTTVAETALSKSEIEAGCKIVIYSFEIDGESHILEEKDFVAFTNPENAKFIKEALLAYTAPLKVESKTTFAITSEATLNQALAKVGKFARGKIWAVTIIKDWAALL
jgi:hypothetical protein